MTNNKVQTYNVLALAVAIGLLFHGASFFSTLENTYDIFVHIFFADHYRDSWFDPWEPSWYTGFSLISYPPLTHQLFALLSFIGGLKFGAFLLAFAIVVLYVTGSYRFAKLITANDEAAAYAALIAVFLPSVVEAFHVFGQIPMMMGISWLLHALPEIYLFVRYGKFRYFFNGMSLIAVAVCSHHVTPIFGMVFFVVPLMGTAVMDGARHEAGSYEKVGIALFIKYVKKYLPRIIFFGFMTIIVAMVVILPYWIWSKSDPITQVPIPHGSRDNFIEVFSSGLVFFIIPWGFLLLIWPYCFYRYFSKRNIFLGLSFAMLTLLGTGGTTPIPKMLLGENAFNILTLERFTFWATIYAMPLGGEFLWRFTKGDLYQRIMARRSKAVYSFYLSIMVICIFFSAGFTMNLSFFRPLQPESINLKPIQNFLQSDKHYKWRYLTLGFGDQMAWLSANTDAMTIDGNYHSARRVPELTTRAIERLENSKYRGVEGIATLQQFLSSPETFHLKYIFSNDKFYDPLLYFSGWLRVKSLSNGITVWERSDVSALPSVLPKKDIPRFQKIMWGIVPICTLLIAFFFNVQLHWIHHVSGSNKLIDDYRNQETLDKKISPLFYFVIKYWILLILLLALGLIAKIYLMNAKQLGPERVVQSYYDALDFKRFEEAHSFIDPADSLTLDRFLLETSVTDGIVDSYGKINTIETEILTSTADYAKIETQLEWITPLESYHKTQLHEVIKKGGKWYIKANEFNNYIPANQFSDIPEVNFLNQGRRKITTKETFHEDVLDRPVLRILQANLVKKGSSYHVVGMIQNVDSYPADLTVKAALIDENQIVLTSYYDKYHLTHKLLPKEITSFRIDFEAVAWNQLKLDSLATLPTPETFKLEVLATVMTQDLYKSISIQDLKIEQDQISGRLYNHGHLTSTITELVYAFFDQHQQIQWVTTSLAEKSVFPMKYADFQSQTMNLDSLQLISPKSLPILQVNGLENENIINKYASQHPAPLLHLTPYPGYDSKFLMINLNNFVGSPGPF
ncbi:hypothetical protein N6H18_17275 [Reichenbachiella agarivorans]|uniref:6-pyruvoyl-tetrahydropterin synthase related domain membrane protein n=1 Tax=Reichenbachiella agarivorans TaxID=2979464 RepID=A0ABY6CNN0_9BACT|nr:hypothetical protein [Reichenbachiella agarivorans]UXP32097.1 hypothetical protein N6H18_17275 [Reichenbachiella agarivorans]